MAAGNTYVAIATQTLGSAAASVTFSSISGAYTDLVLVVNVADTTTTNIYHTLQFNGDTATNYSYTDMAGGGSSAASTRQSTASSMRTNWYATASSGFPMSQIIQIMNYSNATTNKTVLARSNDTASGSGVDASVGLWRSTAAITSVVYAASSGTLGTGTVVSLYGIAAA